MTPDEAAAIALAFAALSDDVTTAAVDREGRPLHGSSSASSAWSRSAPSWATIDEPRTWMDFARRDALALDVDV